MWSVHSSRTRSLLKGCSGGLGATQPRPPAPRGRPRAQTRPETRKVGHFFAQRPAPPRPPAPHRRARAPARPIPPLCPKTGAKTGPRTANAPLHGAESIRRPQTAGGSLPGFPERARLWVGDRLTNSREHSMCRFPAPPAPPRLPTRPCHSPPPAAKQGRRRGKTSRARAAAPPPPPPGPVCTGAVPVPVGRHVAI